MRSFILILLSCLLVTCVSKMSKEDCQNTHWGSKGREDAFKGLTMAELAKYEKQCGDHSVQVQKESYYDGFNQGLNSFCTAERAESFGREGGIYRGQCPKNLEKDFVKPYELAYREYKVEQKEKELKEREEYLEERRDDGKLTLDQAIALSTGKSCSFDSDCTIENECKFSRCTLSGLQCSFDSDCEFKGDCRFSRCVYGQ